MFARTLIIVFGLPSTLPFLTSAFTTSTQARYEVFGRRKQNNIRSRGVSPSPLIVDAVKKETVQDETVSAPASLLFYDDVVDDSIPEGVVCARGVCVLEDFDDDGVTGDATDKSIFDRVLGSYLGPRLLLAGASILYGTNLYKTYWATFISGLLSISVI